MTTQTPKPEALSLSTLSIEDILGEALDLDQITAQMNDPTLRKAKAKPKPLKRDFTPATPTPPRGPDTQISQKEVTFIEHLNSEIALYQHKANSALAREAFLQSLLGA